MIAGLTLKITPMNSVEYYIGQEKGARGENVKVNDIHEPLTAYSTEAGKGGTGKAVQQSGLGM